MPDSTGKVLDSTGKVLEKAKRDIKSTGKISLNAQENEIVAYLTKNSSIKKSDVETLFNVKDSRVRKILETMVSNGVILKEGQGRSTYYILKNKTKVHTKQKLLCFLYSRILALGSVVQTEKKWT